MKPVFLTLLLLATSTSVLAAERYSEVWNPPEAQTVKGNKAKSKSIVATQAKKKRRNVTSVKKVADGSAATQATTTAAPRVKPSPKQSDPLMNLPRKIGPDGQVMRVNYSGG